MKRLFTLEYKAAWDRCLNLARALCYVRNEERRAELKMQLEEATAKKRKKSESGKNETKQLNQRKVRQHNTIIII